MSLGDETLVALSDTAELDGLRGKVRPALDRYFEAVVRRNDALSEMASVAAGYANDTSAGVVIMGDAVRIGCVQASRRRPQASLERTSSEAYRKHFPRGLRSGGYGC